MKSARSLILAGILLAAATGAEAADSYLARTSEKFGTGIVNIATGVVELPKGIYVASEQMGWAAGVPVGFFKGLFQMLGRTGMGAVEMLTFYIPTKPMVNPPFVWENFDKETTYNTNWELYDTH